MSTSSRLRMESSTLDLSTVTTYDPSLSDLSLQTTCGLLRLPSPWIFDEKTLELLKKLSQRRKLLLEYHPRSEPLELKSVVSISTSLTETVLTP
ncbi:hypothetical protein PGTUg99_020133 [Puccinia graminis f. sp. tritici]|uniref:Uncharacterized protein n=1 Tax=Puccinia graminis f. sp. tritici TaxID=56615 RepID=A0A5B0PH41_PUCGR|nr:hypothetical protein PGTUg99_020133 [Puccinia graminis f. sp. tritici]